MTGRSRTRVSYQDTGTLHLFYGGADWGFVPQGQKIRVSEQCDDVVGLRGYDADLTVTRYDYSNFQPFDGATPSTTSSTRAEYNKYYGGSPYDLALSHQNTSFPKTDAAYATELLAKTSPNRYDVDNLQNLVDLKDLPRMLKLGGDTILKKGAGAYLNWNFGWKPLISDLRKMMDFQSRVNKRVKEIHALYGEGGLHRKRELGKASAAADSTWELAGSFWGSPKFRVSDMTTVRKWGTVRWKPTALPYKDESQIRFAAWRLVFGAELSPASVWESLPWTWLVDWFSNTGEFLTQYNNIIPVVASTPCIMTHYQTKRDYTPLHSYKDLKGGTGYAMYETKTRRVTSAALSAGIPFITAYQGSILSALFITKHRAR